ncbi:MAG: MMPL family protein, partial [Pseudomonadota bacterium]
MIRWWIFLLTLLGVVGAFWAGTSRLEIDSDIAASIPDSDPVLSDARHVLSNNPALDKILINVSLSEGSANPDLLVLSANWITEQLRKSGLFKSVGFGITSDVISNLYATILDNLPALYSKRMLSQTVQERLTPEKVRAELKKRHDELTQLDSIGQAQALSKDPLGLRNVILAKLSQLMPKDKIHLYQGHFLSADQKNLLLIALPKKPGSDTAFSSKLVRLFEKVAAEANDVLPKQYARHVSVTAIGGFRAALDNETIVRSDANKALILATLGIALLLILCFPRPLLGLFALLPACAGLAFALLTYSLFASRVSALALGFGGALVSITVDHGIAYLLFLDRTYSTTGRQAAKDVWSVGLFATLTTVG